MTILCRKWNFALIVCAIFALFHLPSYAQEQEAKLPSDFLRDVMQPLGVPVVSSYHLMRENLFLNAKLDKAHPIESIGNFFLAPSQYLFGGRKIIVKDLEAAEFEVVQAFDYSRLHWLKTLVSIIALPISEVVGASLKGLAYLSPEVRERHKKIRSVLHSALVRSQYEVYRQKGLSEFHSDEFVPCQQHKRPSGLAKRQKVEIEALKEITALFDAHNIVYWIDCGTCLGAYRYGGMIPWDWDIDISILMPDHENVKQILSQLDPEKYQIQDWSSYSKPKTFLKLYVKETKNFIDIYHYHIDEQARTVNYYYTFLDSPFPNSWKQSEIKHIKPLKYDTVFPLKKAQFDDLTVWAPNDIIAFLQVKYGTNLDPSMIWDEETNSYQKVENHPYFVE